MRWRSLLWDVKDEGEELPGQKRSGALLLKLVIPHIRSGRIGNLFGMGTGFEISHKYN